MTDKRAKELADLITDYSLSIKPEDALLVQSESVFRDFAQFFTDSAQRKGARVTQDFYDLEKQRETVERNDERELRQESRRLCRLAKDSTAVAWIGTESDPQYLEGVDPSKIEDYQRMVVGPFERIAQRGRWMYSAVPSEGDAKRNGMSLDEYADFLYRITTGINWKELSEKMRRIKARFDNIKNVRVYVPEKTDLSLSLEGRGGELCDGHYNMPDGEICYGPVENSADGYVTFSYPAMYGGKEMKGIKLKFRKGKVVDFKAEENEVFLSQMLKMRGASCLGEFGIGCNPNVTQYINNTLLDEKIAGTVHLALGRSYEQPLYNGGGKNKSAIHMDLVCDLRNGGELYADGKMVQKNGIWQF